MRWASAIATPSHLEDAVDEASEALFAELQVEPDLVFAFVSTTYSDHFAALPKALRSRFPNATNIGCSGGGVIASQKEVECQNAIALVGAVLPDVTIETFHLGSDSSSWEQKFAIDPARSPELIVLTDPFTCNSGAVFTWLDKVLPDSTKIGGIASGGEEPGDCILLLNDELHRTGAIGIALSGNIELDTIVAQGCRPIGAPMFVTRATGPVLYELDGQPAISTLERLLNTLSEEDRNLARSSLFLGIGMHEQQEVYEQGDFLIRRIVGVDPRLHAVAVDAELAEGSIVQFHVRDPLASTEDLQECLSKRQYGAPVGALLFSCMGRGESLYGVSGHDTRLFHEQIGSVPMGGFFCSGEFGPAQGQTFLHSYTSAFGLFRPKHPTAAI